MASKNLTFEIFGKDRSASRTLRGVGDEADRLGSRADRLGSTFKNAAVGIGIGLVAAGAGAVKFGIDSVKAYADAEESQNQLAFAFEKFPALADTNIDSMRRLNTELALKTRYDDDAYAAGEATLAQYGLTGAQLKELTPLMADFAGKTGKDLPTAAEALGKALLGNGRSLKDVGIDFTDTGSLAGNFDAIVGGLRGQVGGFAEEAATTASGKLDILKNKFGEVQEKVGEDLMPVLETAMDWMSTDGVKAVEDLTGVLGDLKGGLEDLSEEDWFKGLTDALGEGGSLDLLKGGAFEEGGIFGPPVNPDFSDWDKTFGLTKETFRRGFGGTWESASEETSRGMENVRGGVGGGFSAIGGDLSVFRQATGEQFSGTWTDADGNTRTGMGTIGGSAGAGLAGLLGQVLGFSPQPGQLFGGAWTDVDGRTRTGMGTIGGSTGTGLGGLLGQLFGFSGQPGPLFGSAWGGANTATVGGWGNIHRSTGEGVGKVGAKVGEIPGVVQSPFWNAGSWLYGAGTNIVGGLIGGISSMIGDAAETAARMAAAAISAAKSALGIQSPSKAFRALGVFTGEGYIEGVESQMKGITATVNAVVRAPTSLTGSGYASSVAGAAGGMVEEHIHVHVDGKEVATAIRRYERGLG